MSAWKAFFKRALKPDILSSLVIIVLCTIFTVLDLPEDFDFDAWYVIGVIGLMFITLLFDVMPTHFSMILALAAVMFGQVVSTSEGLNGFASSSVLAVVVLYIVAAGLTNTGGLNYFMNKLLGRPKNLAVAHLRLMLPVCFLSAFLNNTPLVALMIPIIQQWAPTADLPVSQLFMPLSFAAILGGTCTLIGTSTNLVVSGKAQDDIGFKIALFDLGAVGVPVMLTGVAYVMLFAPYLLPNQAQLDKRAAAANQDKQNLNGESAEIVDFSKKQSIYRNITVSCFVNASSPVVNESVAGANLRGLNGLYLTSVQRKNELIQAVGPEFTISAYDILFFTGIVANFPEFCAAHDFTPITSENEDDLLIPDDLDDLEAQDELAEKLKLKDEPELVDTRSRASTLQEHLIRVLVKPDGQLVGITPKDANFRDVYKAAILSIHRKDSAFSARGNLGRTILRANDILFILTSESFSWDNDETKRDLDLVPENQAIDKKKELDREFIFSMKVSASTELLGVTPLVGKTIEAAGLRGLPGLFLIALERQGSEAKRAVSSDEVLEKDDILWFVGERNSFTILRQIPGLVSPNNQEAKLKFRKVDRRLVECVISMNSDMIGKTIKEAKFRSRFRAAVIAVHREGQRLLQKIGDIELKAGDVLILDTGPYFYQRYRDDRNFLLVAEIENSGVPQFGKFYIALAAVIGMMALFSTLDNYDEISISLFECAVAASAVMIFFNIVSADRAMQSINWDVYVAIACAFGLSDALENSGVAKKIGNSLVDLADTTGTGDTGIIAAVYLATFLISIVVANNAAALLMFPIAVAAIPKVDNNSSGSVIDQYDQAMLRKILYTLMLAASSSFSSPFGYQTNLMVYGPGNYRFIDFVKFGVPMQFWQMFFSVIFVVFLEQWYICWIATIIGFVLLVTASTIYRGRFAPSLLTRGSESTAASTV